MAASAANIVEMLISKINVGDLLYICCTTNLWQIVRIQIGLVASPQSKVKVHLSPASNGGENENYIIQQHEILYVKQQILEWIGEWNWSFTADRTLFDSDTTHQPRPTQNVSSQTRTEGHLA